MQFVAQLKITFLGEHQSVSPHGDWGHITNLLHSEPFKEAKELFETLQYLK